MATAQFSEVNPTIDVGHFDDGTSADSPQDFTLPSVGNRRVDTVDFYNGDSIVHHVGLWLAQAGGDTWPLVTDTTVPAGAGYSVAKVTVSLNVALPPGWYIKTSVHEPLSSSVRVNFIAYGGTL